MKKIVMTIVSAVAAVTALAASRTFTGAKSGSWSDAGNWQDGVPVNGDYVIDTSTRADSTVDLTGLEISGYEYKGSYNGYQLKGNALILQAGAPFINNGMRLYQYCPLVLAEGTHVFNLNARLDNRAVISGEGGIEKTGSDTLALYGANTFTGGFNFLDGTVAECHGQGCGPEGSQVTVAKGMGAKFQFYCGNATYVQDYYYDGDASTPVQICAVESLTRFTGTVTIAQGTALVYLRNGEGRGVGNANFPTPPVIDFAGALVFDGQISDQQMGDGRGTKVYFNCPVNLTSGSYNHMCKSNATFFNVAGNVMLYGCAMNTAGVTTIAEGAFNENIALALACNGGEDVRGYVLTGDNTVATLKTAVLGLSNEHFVTSAVPVTLTVRALENATFEGTVGGPISLVYAPKGDYTLKLINPANYIDGTALEVAGGTLELTDTTFDNIASLTVTSGVLKCAATAVPTRLTTLAIDSVASLDFGGATKEFRVDNFILNGVEQQDSQTYNIGNGISVEVLMKPGRGTEVNWVAGAGSDTSFATALNWDGNVLPNFGPKTLPRFVNGTSAINNEARTVNGFVFDVANGFTLGGEGLFSMYWGGISATDKCANRVINVNAPVQIEGGSEWDIAGTVVVKMAGGIQAGRDPMDIVKQGAGVLELACTNTMSGNLIISNGDVRVKCDEALGAANTGAVYLRRYGETPNNAHLYFYGNTVSRDIYLEGPDKVYYPMLTVMDTGTTTLNGKLHLVGTDNKRIEAQANTTLIFNGGVESSDAMLYLRGAGNFIASGVPLNIAQWYADSQCDFTFAVAGNTVGALNAVSANTTLRIAADDVFAGNGPTMQLSNGVTVDLGGHDMKAARIFGTGSSIANITSATPASIIVTANSVQSSCGAKFTGAAGLTKYGTGELILNAADSIISTTTGDLRVEQGALRLDWKSGWTGGDIYVKNGAHLIVQTGVPLAGYKGSLFLEEGAHITLGGYSPTVTMPAVVSMKVGDEVLRPGTYGGQGSAAQFIRTDIFNASSGILRVLGRASVITIR